MASSNRLERVAIFASGSGSNATRIIQYFRDQEEIMVSLIVTNNPTAGIIAKAKKLGVQVELINNQSAKDGAFLIHLLKKHNIDFIVLAGYLRMIPKQLIQNFSNRIVNIHPALLPKYGGKGMFGINVHKAVSANGDTSSGMTIHFVSEVYDEGEQIFQATCDCHPSDSPEQIARKVLRLEHIYYAPIIEQVILSLY